MNTYPTYQFKYEHIYAVKEVYMIILNHIDHIRSIYIYMNHIYTYMDHI